MRQFTLRNKEHLAATSPSRPAGFYTREFWAERIVLARTELEDGVAVRLVGRLHGAEPIALTVNFTQIVRGPMQACYLGYDCDGAQQGQGLMTEALRAAIAHLFDVLDLHRIMANHLVENVASARVLAKLGFAVEGRAANLLLIAGEWRDHILNARITPHWRGLY